MGGTGQAMRKVVANSKLDGKFLNLPMAFWAARNAERCT